MNRMSRTVAVSLLSMALASLAVAGPGWAQAKTDLTVALSSFSAETLDPALQGHNVKYYLSLMFDYLVGTTPDGQPSQQGGLATKWENSPDHKRWTFHLRKGVKFHNGDEVTSEDVKFSLQRAMGKRSTTGYAGPAPHPHPGHRDAGARPRGHRHQGAHADHPAPTCRARSPPRAWCCPRSTSSRTATTSSPASRWAAAPTSSWSR